MDESIVNVRDNEINCNDIENNLKNCIEDISESSRNSFLFKSQKQFVFNPKNCINIISLERELKKKKITMTFNKLTYYTHYAYLVIYNKEKNMLNVNQFKNN